HDASYWQSFFQQPALTFAFKGPDATICSAAAEEVGSKVRTAGDRTRRRRFNKLSCAGWVPHDRGFVSGLPHSKGRASVRDRLITGQAGFPTVVLLPAVRALDLQASASFPGCRWAVWSGGERRLRDAGDGPDKADHFARDRGGDHDLRLADRSQTAITRVRPQLGFPGNSARHRRQLLIAVVQLAADPCRHAVGPGPPISTRRASTLPALVMPPRRMLAPDECSEGTRPR